VFLDSLFLFFSFFFYSLLFFMDGALATDVLPTDFYGDVAWIGVIEGYTWSLA